MATPHPVRDLTRAVGRGEPSAVAWLYETHAPMVLAAVRRAGVREDSAMDIVHDTFLKAVRAMPVISSQTVLETWLRRVALRTALDHHRRERRRARREAATGPSPLPREAEHVSALRRELATLPGSSRELLQLRFQAGLTLDAVARRVGSTTGAVDGRLRRALTALRHSLRAEDDA